MSQKKDTLKTVFWIVFFVVILNGLNMAENITIAEGRNTNIQASHVSNDFIANYLYDPSTVKTADVIGISMQPTFFTGNLLIIADVTDISQLHEGDIVVVKQPNKNEFVHRIKAIYHDYIITQGDSNRISERIDFSEIEGLVIGVLYA